MVTGRVNAVLTNVNPFGSVTTYDMCCDVTEEGSTSGRAISPTQGNPAWRGERYRMRN